MARFFRRRKFCRFTAENVKEIDYKDLAVLKQYITETGKIYQFDISIEPMAHRFKKGNRIRLEIVNGDSVLTDVLWTHYYLPNKIGTDTIYHSAAYPSTLTLPRNNFV